MERLLIFCCKGEQVYNNPVHIFEACDLFQCAPDGWVNSESVICCY